MLTGLRSGVSLRSGIVLDDLGIELVGNISPTVPRVAWCLRGWEFKKTHNIWNLWTRSALGCLRGGVFWLVLLWLAYVRRLFFVDIIKLGT